jgi:hypothetical protein
VRSIGGRFCEQSSLVFRWFTVFSTVFNQKGRNSLKGWLRPSHISTGLDRLVSTPFLRFVGNTSSWNRWSADGVGAITWQSSETSEGLVLWP